MEGLEVDYNRSADLTTRNGFFLPRSKYRVLVIAFFIHLLVGLVHQEVYQGSNALGHVIIAVLCVLDTYLLATRFTIPVEDNIQDESKITTKVSKRVDRFFSRGQTMPCVSFLVNVFYALTVVMFGLACFFLTSTYVSLGATRDVPDKNDPTGIDSAMDTLDFDGNTTMEIPLELKPWAVYQVNHYSTDYKTEPEISDEILATYKGSFLHTSNGVTYTKSFKTGRSRDDTESKHTRGYDPAKYFEILYETYNGQVSSFPNIYNPSYFTMIDVADSFKFCFLGSSLDSSVIVYCTLPNEKSGGIGVSSFRNVTLSLTAFNVMRDIKIPPAVGFAGKLWFKSILHRQGRHHTLVYAVDYATMAYNSTIVRNRGNHNLYKRRNTRSSEEFNAIPWVVFGMAVMVGSIYILVGRGIPSGAATLCFGCKNAVGVLVYDVFDGVFMNLLHVLNFIWVIATTRMLLMSSTPRLPLPPWCCGAVDSDNAPGVHKDVLLWGLYSGIALLLYPPDYEFEESIRVLICLVSCVVIGLILNHPACQALGWTSGMVFTFIALFSTWSTMEMLWTLLAGGILSWGLGTLGFKLAQYRPTLVVLFRRWHALIHSEIRRQFSSTTNEGQVDQPDMTEPLNRGVA